MPLRPAAPAELEDALTRAQQAVNDAIRACHDVPESERSHVIEALDKAVAGEAAKLANKRFGQWMPERWLWLFVEEYNKLKVTKRLSTEETFAAIKQTDADA